MSQTIRSSRLEVRIREPGEVYRASRFDWSTNVDSIVLDGTHQFASAESLDPADRNTRGAGLHAEFGIRTALGYDDVVFGGRFYKIGVGAIRRESQEAYNFYTLYKDIQPATMMFRKIEHVGGEELEIKQYTAPGKDFGWKLIRRYRVNGRNLSVSNELTNTGTRPISTNEYCHNFLKLGEKNLGPDYELGFNFPVAPVFEAVRDKTGILDAAQNMIPRFVKEPGIGGEHQFWVGGLLDPTASNGNAAWYLRDAKTGLSVSERLEGPCKRVDMWGMRHVCSVELFAAIHLDPGATQRWVRQYSFGSETDSWKPA